ncbi:MAG: PilN domain-containing protein [Candidatus Binatia bacterium]
MIRINLLPTKEKAEAASQRQEVTLFVLALVLLVGLCALLSFGQMRRSASLTSEISSLEEALKALESQVRDVADLEKKRKDLDSKLKVIAELGVKRVGPAKVLKDLAGATPARVWLTEFTELNGGATLTGQAVDNQQIAQFLRDLSESTYFTSVDLVETTQSETGDLKLRKFILKANVNYAATQQEASRTDAPPEQGPQG